MKLNTEELSGFVALGCKSTSTGLIKPQVIFKVTRISSLLAQDSNDLNSYYKTTG